MSDDKLKASTPTLHPTVFVAPGAVVTGDVRLAEESSVWFNATLRGDIEPLIIGARTNVQDGCVFHTSRGFPVELGEGVTVGHAAVIHGATVGANTLIGIGAVLLNGAKVEENCIIAAGSVLTEGKRFPAGSLILGTPARVVRELTTDEIEDNRRAAEHYVGRAAEQRQIIQGGYRDGPGAANTR
jgi:carbonic anhydrase/acetyltransferase-like protein (isoleucine patch superfamily)